MEGNRAGKVGIWGSTWPEDGGDRGLLRRGLDDVGERLAEAVVKGLLELMLRAMRVGEE